MVIINTYIALLRGINISGKNKVEMPLLKAAFEKAGFTDVQTYINSGNVIFKSAESNRQALIKKCEAIVEQGFKINVPVSVTSLDELNEALKHAPEWWDACSEEEIIHQAIFLIPPVTVKEVFEAVGEARPEYEKVGVYQNIIFWSAPRAALSRARWYKIASSAVNGKVTIRNASTAKKLAELCV